MRQLPILLVLGMMLVAHLLMPGALADQVADDASSMPHMTAEHRIVSGANSLWRKTGWPQLSLNIDADAIAAYFEMFNLGQGEIHPVFFLNKNQVEDERSSVLTADIRDSNSSDVKLGTYQQSMTLLDNGLVEIKGVVDLSDQSLLKDRYAILDMPSYLTLTGELVRDGHSIPLDGAVPTTFTAEQLAGAELHFFPNQPQRSFKILPVSVSALIVNGNRLSIRPGGDGVLSWLLDLRSSGGEQVGSGRELSPNGIDFWGVDRLKLPDYRASKNLIQNPSFEAGLRYWGFPIYVGSMIPLEHQGVFALDREVGHTGGSSLRLKALPVRSPLSIGHMPTPFIPGEPYVYSFYAKASPGRSLLLHAWGRGRDPQLFPENVLTFTITDQWQRFTIPFTAVGRFSCIYLYATDPKGADGGDDAFVWVDDVQLEQGEEATAFVDTAVAAELVSSARGNFLEFGQSPDFALSIYTLPNASGSVSLAVEDFYFETVYEGSYAFTTDADGRARIALEDLSGWLIDSGMRGVYSVSAEFDIEGLDEMVADHFRFSSMDFLNNTHKNKDIFNLTYVYSLQAGGPEMERFMQRERAIGFGSIAYDFIGFALDHDYDLDRERMELVEQYGFAHMGRPVLQLHSGDGGEISEQQGAIKMTGIKNMTDPTPEQLQQFEDIVALKAGSRPWNKVWWFTGESNPGVMPLEADRDAFASFLLATYRGVKRGNPDAEVLIEGGPWTIEPQYGAKWVERYIQDTRRLDPSIEFDGAAAHHYRNFPENPDLDGDIGAFLEMLDRNGCEDWPLHVNEGGNYIPFNIPQEGISPYIIHSGNSWYIGPLSYHYGRSERISAAFSARNWLIGLKYADRVACMQDFNTPQRYVDADLTPRPYDKIPNTLGRLLGNASFDRDLPLAAEVRGYLFTDDPTGRPIAALWGHREAVDRWKQEPPVYLFDFAGQDVTFVDLMENEVTFPQTTDGRTAIPMSPFPIFVLGRAGAADSLATAITGAEPQADAAVPPLKVKAIPTADGGATLWFENTRAEPANHRVTVNINGRSSQQVVKVPGLEEQTTTLALPATDDALRPFDLTVKLGDQTLTEIGGRYVVLDRQAASGPAAIGSDARVELATDGRSLTITLTAPNNGQASVERFAGTGLYFTPMLQIENWDQARTARQDMAIFELQRGDADGLVAMCHYVQGTQAGSGTDLLRADQVQRAITVNATTSGDDARLVIHIPQEVLAPFKFEPGNHVGFNLSLPAGDGVASLVPMRGYESPKQPGEMMLALILIGD